MPRTKISEFSTTAGNNTDIDGINIAEGCAPSGINDAIRELMAQLKDFQAGTAGDSFNGPIGSTTPAAGAFTNLSASGTFALTGDQVQISEGGTGQTTANAAFNALAPSQTSQAGKYLKTDGTNTSWDAIDINTADITGTLPIANGGTGLTALGTGVQTALGQNVTGSGGIVLATSPTLVTPALGTPSSVTLTNATGLPLSTGVTGTLATTNGGTGLTSFTANGVVYASSSSALTTGSALTFSGGIFGVSDASSPRISVEGSSTASGYLIFKNTTSGLNRGYVGYEFANDAMPFAVAGSEQMRLTSTGLGIGTSSPSFKLDVSGANAQSIRVTSSNGDLANLVMNSTGNASWSLSSDTVMRFKKDSTEYMRLDSSGNLGIGTSSPAYKLDVQGSATDFVAFNGLNTNNNSGLATSSAIKFGFTSTVGTHYATLKITEDAGNDNSGSLTISLPFGGVESTKLTLNSSGNLGLGVTPSAWNSSQWSVFEGAYGGALAFYKASDVPVTVLTSNAYNDGAWKYKTTDPALQYEMDGNVGIHKWYTAPSGTAGNTISFTQAMTLDASGNLLVGATSAVGRFTLENAATTVEMTLRSTGGVGTNNRARIIGGYEAGGSDYGGYLAFNTTSTSNVNGERARITSGGDLLVGTTSYGGGANVAGFGANPVGQIAVERDGGIAGVFNRFTSDGDIVIFRRSATTVGSVSVTTTATAYNTSSDYRLKNITGPITTSGAYIDSLNPVEGTWKADGSTFVGLIAHEVQEASRTSVATGVKDGEEMQGMDYSSAEIIANIIAELQSLRARVAQLEAK